jgi:hypothetical protein
MLFQFFRPQLQRERPAISSMVCREYRQMDIGGNIRVEIVDVDDASSRSAPQVIIVEERPAKKA